MSGSSESNEDLVAGRVNRSNDQTTLWAENRYVETGIFGGLGGEEFRIDFGGNPILLVEVARDSEEDGEFRPASPLDGIVGRGWSAEHAGQSGGTGVVAIGGPVEGAGLRAIGGANGTGAIGDGGGIASGVVGFGGPNEGTGVVGIGSGGERNLGPHLGFDSRRGRGGVGVWGLGGLADLDRPSSQPEVPPSPDVLPGTGVLGQGGKIEERNEKRMLLGPGVVGIGGAAGDLERPTMSDAGSAGVFGKGAEARIRTEFDAGTPVQLGPAEAGPGVVGIGGVPDPLEFPVGAGVIGLAGGETRPGINETGETGVYGRGRTGMRAQGLGGPGVLGRSEHDRGGVFEAGDGNAQVNLVPNRVRTRLPEETGITPMALSPAAVTSGVVALPRNGLGGDLAALEDLTGRCTLWFCVESSSGGVPAKWAQVLLGPMFDGTT